MWRQPYSSYFGSQRFWRERKWLPATREPPVAVQLLRDTAALPVRQERAGLWFFESGTDRRSAYLSLSRARARTRGISTLPFVSAPVI